MRRSPRFVRIVADHRTFLMAVERFDRGIHIENPRLVEQRPDAIIEMRLQPLHARGFVDLRQRPPQRIFADHFAHAEQWRVDRIAAQCRDVRIAPVPGQHRQQQGAQHVAFARRVGAGEEQRAIRHPAVKQTALLQILNEKRQLSEWRDRCRGVPLDMDTAGKRIGDRRPLLYLRLLTYRVSNPLAQICPHTAPIRRSGHSAQPPTAGFRMIRQPSPRAALQLTRPTV
jgi:hypothetical protein